MPSPTVMPQVSQKSEKKLVSVSMGVCLGGGTF